MGKPAPRMAQKADKTKASLIQDITNRFRVTAREARDIVTAVGTANVLGKTATQSDKNLKKIGEGVNKQIKETITAAKTGKKGTTADQIKETPVKGKFGTVKQTFKEGKQR